MRSTHALDSSDGILSRETEVRSWVRRNSCIIATHMGVSRRIDGIYLGSEMSTFTAIISFVITDQKRR
jgi:hypothetical protein